MRPLSKAGAVERYAGSEFGDKGNLVGALTCTTVACSYLAL
jgi:hypothetical protein